MNNIYTEKCMDHKFRAQRSFAKWKHLCIHHLDQEIEHSSTVTWKDLEIIKLSEVSQRKTNIMWYCLYVESKKNDTNELIYKTETDIENKPMATKGERERNKLGTQD